MVSERPLPSNEGFEDVEAYIASLLSFVSNKSLFRTLCGGVHVLDFLTRETDLYESVLPSEWREWFALQSLDDILHFILHEDLALLRELRASHDRTTSDRSAASTLVQSPPVGLLDYLIAIRTHVLQRSFERPKAAPCLPSLPHQLKLGMKPKKLHEVENFANYVHQLSNVVSQSAEQDRFHVIDFGSGQNYLGRMLASPPYSKSVIALESKEHNIAGARTMDVNAKIVKKGMQIRNKKLYRQEAANAQASKNGVAASDQDEVDSGPGVGRSESSNILQPWDGTYGDIRYIRTNIESGDLSAVKSASSSDGNPLDMQAMVVSLHSCGNLIHHGLRSLLINPFVKAVCMVGCCYNLMTERLGPSTFKHPSLRDHNPRVERAASAQDPHGFPMSQRLAQYPNGDELGIRFNVTARMMACQAPENWTDEVCETFFRKHFYRALLQRILLDNGVIGRPEPPDHNERISCSNDSYPAILIGSLRKSCYRSFNAYVRGALAKVSEDASLRILIAGKLVSLSDDDIQEYETKYGSRKKDLSILWTLMAFSAGVVESTIVVDRWLFLSEQPEVSQCWAEPVFEYGQSPRNLAVVGIKG